MSFFSTEPPAQKATKQTRQQCGNDFGQFVGAQFPPSPNPVCVPCLFGQDPDDVVVAQNLFASSPISTTDSEALGEQGAISFLQDHLAKMGVDYDDAYTTL